MRQKNIEYWPSFYTLKNEFALDKFTDFMEVICDLLQYQWMPFFIGALAICFYLPYILHMYGNNDLINLKKSLKQGQYKSLVKTSTMLVILNKL